MGDKVCVNCVSPVKDLYKTYSSNVIKISECVRMSEIFEKNPRFYNFPIFSGTMQRSSGQVRGM